jgi:tRNA threonylcarbamoyladenosine biosynthesis protein TsaE
MSDNKTSALVFHAATLEETNIIAAQILQRLGESAVISLEGPLGAGKTHFVKAIAAAMGLSDQVTSPTFTLLQSYGSHGKQLHHADLYRLKNEAELLDLGLSDYFFEGLTIIEWGDKFFNLLPQDSVRIVIKILPQEVREISCHFPPQ